MKQRITIRSEIQSKFNKGELTFKELNKLYKENELILDYTAEEIIEAKMLEKLLFQKVVEIKNPNTILL